METDSQARIASTAINNALTQALFGALPQTQCQRCGFKDCLAYAQAIADGIADTNQCPPGGKEGVVRLTQIFIASSTSDAVCEKSIRVGNELELELNVKYGVETARTVAKIDENWCIGCTLCLAACPVDAIIGSNKMMHSVLTDHCTGCDLCLPVCPVDCIEMVPVSGVKTGWAAWSSQQADSSLLRYQRHKKLQVKKTIEPQPKNPNQHALQSVNDVLKTGAEPQSPSLAMVLAQARLNKISSKTQDPIA